ncbi:MAG: hypothetical protein FJ265_04730 [Planctomycetes bacterium]|nr:hypothetical protein [Planctomycetota bacterium]
MLAARLFATAVAAAMHAFAIAQPALTVPLADRHPELAALSSWTQQIDRRTDAAAIARGVFPLGNGSVFGHFGLGKHASTVQGLSGPTYQTDTPWAPHGHFGEQSFVLRADGADLDLPVQTIARVRGANFVVTEDRDDRGVRLVTLNFAPPGGTDLHRIVEVHNGSSGPLRGVELRALVPRAAPAGGDLAGLQAVHASTARPYRARFCIAAGGFVAEGQLVRPFGDLAPGATVRAAFTMRTSRGDDPQLRVDPEAAAIAASAATTLAHWRQRLAGTATFRSEPPRFADLLEDWKVLLLAHQSRAAGLVAPMVNHRICRVRDLAGPLLLCLRYNLHADARAMLQAICRSAARRGALTEILPLDVAWTSDDEDPARWADATIPAGGLGSLVVLYHEWYWRASGDLGPIRAHWPFLQRCLDGQRFSADGLQAFGGDEDHFVLHRLLGSRLDDRSALVAHAPAAGRSALSFEANALFVIANMALGELQCALQPPAAAAGPAKAKVDPDALRRTIEVALRTEQAFWQPAAGRFAPALSPLGPTPHPGALADVNLRLQWLGWTFASAGRNRANLQATLRDLWRAPDAVRVGATAGTGFATGATQPLLLYALADLDDHGRAGAAAELLRMAGPAGEWGALCDPDGAPTWTHDPGWPDRCQPGPSGLAIDALCFACTGLRYASVPSWDDGREARFRPRLPPGTTRFVCRDVRRDGRHLHLAMEQVLARLGEDELRQQEERIAAGLQKPESRLDPAREHPRFRYHVEMVNPPPDDQHIVCAVNLGHSQLVRYLATRLPSFGDSLDLPTDPQTAWPAPGSAMAAPPAAALPTRGGATTLVLTVRGDAMARHRDLPARFVDLGLPQDFTRLAALLRQEPRFERVVVDVGVDDAGALTARGAGCTTRAPLATALAAFAAAGGTVQRPEFVSTWRVAGPIAPLPAPASGTAHWPGADSPLAWRPVDAAANGLVTAATATGGRGPAAHLAAVLLDAAADADVVLRAGADGPFTIRLDERVVLAQPGFDPAAADQAEAPLQLTKGRHRLVVELTDRGGGATFLLRCCGADGLPVRGLTAVRP